MCVGAVFFRSADGTSGLASVRSYGGEEPIQETIREPKRERFTMRKMSGLMLVVAMMVPIGVIGAGPAGAVGGTVCAAAAGTATFTPPLPILTSKTKVFGNLVAIGTLGKCVGGGVTSAHTKFTSTKSTTGSNCTTLITYNPTAKPTMGTEVITWNTGKTSTVALQLHQVKGHATETTVTGTVTAGLFKGSHQTGSLTYTPQPNGCSKVPLKTVTYTQLTGVKGVIK